MSLDRKKLVPKGTVTDTFPAKTFFEYDVELGFADGGSYLIETDPDEVWISVFDDDKTTKLYYGKGACKVKLGPGKYVVKIRHSIQEDTPISTTLTPRPRKIAPLSPTQPKA
jgi:hypothetical protein